MTRAADALTANTGLEGRVEITISIGASGKVTDADVSIAFSLESNK